MCCVLRSDAGLFVYGCDLSSTAVQLLRVSLTSALVFSSTL